ncbi:TetR family transcriptional regulator [Paenibacillus sp. TH7-28]
MAPKVSEDYKKQKKLDLLQAAKRVFVNKGYTRATMQDIIDEAGVSRGALYAYFGSIEHVYLELLQHEDQRDVHYFRTDGEGTSWEQIVRWILERRREMETMDQTLLLANSEFFLSAKYQKDKPGYLYTVARYEQLIDALTGFLRRGTARGDISPRLPVESIPHYFVTFIDGLMIDSAHLGSETTKMNEQIEVLLFTMKALLCPVKPASNENDNGGRNHVI